MPITPQEALVRCIEHREIFHDEMVDLMRQIMRGDVSPTMTAAIAIKAGARPRSTTCLPLFRSADFILKVRPSIRQVASLRNSEGWIACPVPGIGSQLVFPPWLIPTK